MKEEQSNKAVYAVIVFLAILTLAGFYFVFDKIAELKTAERNLELMFDLYLKTKNGPAIVATQTSSPATVPTSTESNIPDEPAILASIPTAILFKTQSSPTLQPQTELTVTIENVTKNTQGEITLHIKVFSNEASSYSAFDPSTVLEIVDLEGANQKASKVNGSFASIPPKSSASGSVIFSPEISRNTFVLQIGAPDSAKYYEFNFSAKTYKEVILG